MLTLFVGIKGFYGSNYRLIIKWTLFSFCTWITCTATLQLQSGIIRVTDALKETKGENGSTGQVCNLLGLTGSQVGKDEGVSEGQASDYLFRAHNFQKHALQFFVFIPHGISDHLASQGKEGVEGGGRVGLCQGVVGVLGELVEAGEVGLEGDEDAVLGCVFVGRF